MNKMRLWLVWIGLSALGASAQQVMYANLKELAEGRGDTVTTLLVEKRTRNQLLLMGGADYRIEAVNNRGMNRYLRKRCHAVRIDTALYVNCRKMRYKNFRFGNWYASAMRVGDRVYYCAQPVGQAASSSTVPDDAARLAGEVGDAIAASGLVNERVCYELDLQTGRSSFLSRGRMMELLEDYPVLQEAFAKETGESAEVMVRYLRRLQKMLLIGKNE